MTREASPADVQRERAARPGLSQSTATLWSALCDTAARWPERDAIVQGTRRTTFAEWHRRALDFGAWFARSDFDKGSRVLLQLDPGAQMAAAVFGSWAADCIPVLCDPRARGPALRAAIACAQPEVAIAPAGAPAPDIVSVDPEKVPAQSGFRAAGPASATDPASILFTSGSTGGPKGVTQPHRNLLDGCRTVSSYLGLDADDRILCPVPWSFDYGFMQLQASALTGATQILPVGPTPADLCAAIERDRPTVLAGVPSIYAYLLQRISPFRTTDRSSIRLWTNTGGAISVTALEELLDLLEPARCFLNYGLTESYRTSYLDPSLVSAHPRSIGRSIEGVGVAIVRDDGTEAGVDEVGEIVHRGDFVFSHYWDDPQATARALRPDPLGPESPESDPVLFTGDLGRIDADSLLYFEGRRDQLIKSMGVRVSPDEVEQILMNSGLVEEVAVFGVPNELSGQEVCAAIVPRAGVDDARRALLRYARAQMSPHMMPRRYRECGELPRTHSGKVDYAALSREI